MGYHIIKVEEDLTEPTWWQTTSWNINCPLKNILFLWLTLVGKIHVWDHIAIFMGIGTTQCSMCFNDGDYIDHIFIKFPYIVDMWKYVYANIGKSYAWDG